MAFTDYLKSLSESTENGVHDVMSGLVSIEHETLAAIRSVLNYIAANPQALKDVEAVADVALTTTGNVQGVALANSAGSALQAIANVSQAPSPTITSAVQILQAAKSVATASGNVGTAAHIDNVVNALLQNTSLVQTTAAPSS
jgi:hypothetical protein